MKVSQGWCGQIGWEVGRLKWFTRDQYLGKLYVATLQYLPMRGSLSVKRHTEQHKGIRKRPCAPNPNRAYMHTHTHPGCNSNSHNSFPWTYTALGNISQQLWMDTWSWKNLKAAGSAAGSRGKTGGKTWQCWRVVPMASPSLLPCDTQEPTQEPLKDIEGWRVRWKIRQKMAMTMQFGPSKIRHSVPRIDVSCDFNRGALGSLSQYLTVATVADLAPPVPSGTRPTSRVQGNLTDPVVVWRLWSFYIFWKHFLHV